MDKNRPDQCNPNHKPTGPGHDAGYKGDRSKPVMEDRAEKKNPNNPKYQPAN